MGYSLAHLSTVSAVVLVVLLQGLIRVDAKEPLTTRCTDATCDKCEGLESNMKGSTTVTTMKPLAATASCKTICNAFAYKKNKCKKISNSGLGVISQCQCYDDAPPPDSPKGDKSDSLKKLDANKKDPISIQCKDDKCTKCEALKSSLKTADGKTTYTIDPKKSLPATANCPDICTSFAFEHNKCTKVTEGYKVPIYKCQCYNGDNPPPSPTGGPDDALKKLDSKAGSSSAGGSSSSKKTKV